MKKIIYLANTRLPTEKAHGFQSMKTCESFSRAGARVTFVAPYRKNIITEDPFAFYSIPKIFKIVTVPSLDSLVLGPIGFLIQRGTFISSAMIFSLFNRGDFYYSRDIVLSFLLSFISRNVVFEDHEPLRNHTLYAFFLKRIPYKVIVAAHLRQLYEEMGVPLGRVIHAPNGVDLEAFNATPRKHEIWNEKYGIEKGNKIALYAGHFYQWKGVYTVIDAIRFLRPGVSVVLVGGTLQGSKEIQQYADERDSSITLIPFMPRGELVQLVKSADVLLLPNTAKEERSQMYTTPLKLFEYMASRVPIVASRLPSFEPYIHEKSAEFCDPDDPESLAQAITKVLTDNKRAEDLQNNAYHDVAQFNWQLRGRKILESLSHIKATT